MEPISVSIGTHDYDIRYNHELNTLIECLIIEIQKQNILLERIHNSIIQDSPLW